MEETNGQAPENGQGPEGDGKVCGYDSVDDLVAAHQTIQTQVTELESLKGRQGNELGELRRELAQAQSHAQETREEKPTITRAEIQTKLDADDITEGEAFDMRDNLIRAEVRVETQKIIADAKAKTDYDGYVIQYMKDNPGYEKAYNEGLLRTDITKGYSAEHAYSRYQNREIAEKLKNKEAELQTKTDKAQKDGVQAGVKVEQQKNQAGKVLSGGQTGTFRGSQNPNPLTREQQREKGAELIARMRSAPGK